MKVKRTKFKKRIAAMMTVSILSLCFSLPNAAHAQTVTIGGKNIYTYIVASASSATATISYTEGSGQVWALVIGDASNMIHPDEFKSVSGPKNSNPTPGGASSSVSAPNGWSFYHASSVCGYEVYIHGTTYKDTIAEGLSLE